MSMKIGYKYFYISDSTW